MTAESGAISWERSDDGRVAKVMTFKAGKFVFSRRFDVAAVSPTLIKAQTMYDSVADLPILPGAAAHLEADIIRKSIFGTAAMEGNPLAEDEVGELLERPDARAVVQRTEREILNLKAAYAHVDALPKGKDPECGIRVDEAHVRDLNQLITQGVDYFQHSPGSYRDHRVEVGDAAHGGTYVPPRAKKDIEALMAAFTEWINSSDVAAAGIPSRAALAHYHLACIHPFADGNGRTARLVESAVMIGCGIKYVPKMLSNFYYRHVDEYYTVFRQSQKNKDGDITPFMEFFARGLLDSVTMLQTIVHESIRHMTLRAAFDEMRRERHVTQRQSDLLRLLLEGDQSFTLSELLTREPFNLLYRTVSEATARRDIKRLMELGCLRSEDGRYSLNRRMLG